MLNISSGSLGLLIELLLAMKKNSDYILALLMMPPPVHGASVINSKMVDKLLENGLNVEVVNTVPSKMKGFFGGWVWKLFRFLLIFRLFFVLLGRFNNPPRMVYIGVSGGAGLVFDSILALVFRFYKSDVVVHHHSFSYVLTRSLVFDFFCFLLQKCNVTHVVLCESMGEKLSQNYSLYISSKNIHVLSNASFGESVFFDSCAVDREFVRVGFISNITREKGVFDVIDLFHNCQSKGVGLHFSVAGPCVDVEIKKMLEKLDSEFDNFSYLGAIYGAAKGEFYKSLDVLVFPTRYINEAEPLVIHESAEYGVPVISNSRGCIASVVNNLGGWVVSSEDCFVDEATDILSYIVKSNCKGTIRNRVLDASRSLNSASRDSLNALVIKMGGGDDATS